MPGNQTETARRPVAGRGSISALLLVLLLALGGAATAGDARQCANEHLALDADFDGGALGRCRFDGRDRVVLTIRPEDRKVRVEQPWYAFRITADTRTLVDVRFEFPDGYARYWPKLSMDGADWSRAPAEDVEIAESGKSMTLRLPVSAQPTWVAAQELLTAAWYEEWLRELDAHDEVGTTVIATSTEHRPIYLARSEARPEVVILLGRQHPAEVPGAIAMRVFVDTVLADTDLARAFRERFMLLIVPLLNPDGVANGHWRHNAGRTDLNRDWGPFTQPETRAIADLLDAVDTLGLQPRLMLDFHATKFTDSALFYTQTADDATDPPDFAVRWLGRVRERAPDYAFDHAPRPTSPQKNTKGYFFTRYGIPSFTYEIGDAAERAPLIEVTPVFAEEMMRTLLGP